MTATDFDASLATPAALAPRGAALVVEDDEQFAYLLRFLLEREGYAVEVARDGRAAIELAARIAPPALVTIDVMLPYFDGYQVLAQLRAQPGWSEVPVIMLSAKPERAGKARGLRAGASEYLPKPVKLDELRAAIRRLAAAR
jgi:DNA-binding response OmpR family regulator